MAAGRPIFHTKEIELELLSRLSEMSLIKVCAMDDMPVRSVVYRWMDDIEGFKDKYTRACEERADHRAEMIDEIAQQCLSGEVDPQAARVAIDAYKWTASKLKSKNYGDRVAITGDAANPLTMVIREISGNTLGPSCD